MVKEQKDLYVSPEVTTLEIKIQAITCHHERAPSMVCAGRSVERHVRRWRRNNVFIEKIIIFD